MSKKLIVAALGSSFAAGPGILPYADRSAMRSSANYAHVLAHELDADLTDLSVSGATTESVVEVGQRVLLRRYGPQIEGIPSDADLVTITVGGNDLHYIGSILRAGVSGWARTRRLTRPLAALLSAGALPSVSTEDLEKATAGLAGVVAEAQVRAPAARVVLVDYLTVLGDETRPGADVPFDQTTIDALRGIGDRLVDAFAAAAESSGADLVQASMLSIGHALGSAEPWVNGLVLRPNLFASSYHPNAAGMRAIAFETLRILEM